MNSTPPSTPSAFSLRSWVRAARPLAHANIAPPLLLGEALAIHEGAIAHVSIFVLVHLFGLFNHLFIVFSNDIADEATDRDNTSFLPFSGGSRVLVDHALTPRALQYGATLAGTLMIVVAFALAFMQHAWLAPWCVVAAFALLFAYSFPPLKLSYRGGGEWLQAVGTGFVLPVLGWHAFAPLYLPPRPAVFLGLVLLGVASHVMTALPDAPSDARGGKHTLVVAMGENISTIVALAASLLGAIAVVYAAALPPLHRWICLAAAIVPWLVAFIARLTTRTWTRRELLRFTLPLGASLTLTQVTAAVALLLS